MIFSQNSKSFRCPGCRKKYDSDQIYPNTLIEKSRLHYHSYQFGFICDSGEQIGELQCGYQFHVFSGDNGSEESRDFYDEQWSLFQKHRFYLEQSGIWIVVFWQQSFERYKPKKLTELIGENLFKMLLNQFTYRNSIVSFVFQKTEESEQWELSLRPEKRHLRRYFSDDCLKHFDLDCKPFLMDSVIKLEEKWKVTARGVSEETTDISDPKSEVSEIPFDPRLDVEISSGGALLFLHSIRVGTELVGIIIATGISLIEVSEAVSNESTKFELKKHIGEAISHDTKSEPVHNRSEPVFNFHVGIGKIIGEQFGFKDFIDYYKTFLGFATEITELARASYDRKRKSRDELFMKETVSRMERRYETRFEPESLTVFTEEALGRIVTYFGIEKIVYFTSEYHTNRLVARFDSAKTKFRPEGPRSLFVSEGDYEFEIVIRINNDLRRFLQTNQPYYFLGYHGIKKTVFFRRSEVLKAIRQGMDQAEYARDEDIYCLAPINISMMGPAHKGLLAFTVKKGVFSFVQHRELYERVIRVLSMILRRNQAEQARRNEYGRAIHEILEPHGAMIDRLDNLKNRIFRERRNDEEVLRCTELLDAKVQLITTLKDTLGFGKRLVNITDKMKISLEGKDLIPEIAKIKVVPLFTAVFGQVKMLAKDKKVFIRIVPFLERIRKLEVYCDPKLTEQVIYHSLMNAIT